MNNEQDNTEAGEAQQLAERVAAAMYQGDQASQALGIIIDGVAPGWAWLRMTVRQDMLNGHGICHGGMIFTLADTAFAIACNSRNQSTVAQKCSIDFLAAAADGDELTAVAEERTVGGRTGVYDISVRNQTDSLIALMRGNSYRIRGALVETLGQ